MMQATESSTDICGKQILFSIILYLWLSAFTSPTLSHGLLLSNCYNIVIRLLCYIMRRSAPVLYRTPRDDHNSAPLPYVVCLKHPPLAAGDTNRVFAPQGLPSFARRYE